MTALAFASGDGRLLATGCASFGCVRLWDLRSPSAPHLLAAAQRGGRAPRSGTGRARGVTALACDPSAPCRLVAAFADSSLSLFDATRPERGALRSFDGHRGASFYVKVAFSGDGTHIVSGSTDRRVWLWRVDAPAGDGGVALDGHCGEVTAVDWCATHFGRIASCSDDGTLRLWAIRRGAHQAHCATEFAAATSAIAPQTQMQPIRPLSQLGPQRAGPREQAANQPND